MTCRIDGCDKQRLPGKTLCSMHAARKQRNGDPLALRRPSPEVRFWRLVEKSEGCWSWTGPCTPNGYGKFRLAGHSRMAHRFAYELLVGPVADELEIDHLCRVRNCVNPAHLEAVTRAENVRRSAIGRWQREKTHCPAGHPYDEANTYHPPSQPNERMCRACRREASSRYELTRRPRKVGAK